jgi:hypothetical protein
MISVYDFCFLLHRNVSIKTYQNAAQEVSFTICTLLLIYLLYFDFYRILKCVFIKSEKLKYIKKYIQFGFVMYMN